jgi:allophanate hydrolase subunit 1
VERLLVALAPNVGIKPVELAAALDDDIEARKLGLRRLALEGSIWKDLVPDVSTMVVILGPINVSTRTASELLRRLVVELQSAQSNQANLELTEMATTYGDPIIVIRQSRLA